MLEVDALSAGYGSIQVLHGISLQVRTGQSVCLIGANGAGKTTFLRCLAGLVRASGGRIRIDNKEIRIGRFSSARFGMTLVPEGRRVFAPMSVARISKWGPSGAFGRVETVLSPPIWTWFSIFSRDSRTRETGGGTSVRR